MTKTAMTKTAMSKTAVAALLLVTMLSPSLAVAGGMISIPPTFSISPRTESPTNVDISGAFHTTDDDNQYDDIFHPQAPQADNGMIHRDIGLHFGGGIGLANSAGDIGLSQVVSPKGGQGGVTVAKVDLTDMLLKCDVAGTPSEFPNDLRIRNAGLVTLPAGTQIKWKAAGEAGIAVFGKALAPGQSAKLANVLDHAIEAGTTCSAKAIGL